MSQFNPPSFQPTSFNTNELFHSDIQIQFAPTVPPNPSSRRSPTSDHHHHQQQLMHFHNPSFQHQEVLTPHPSFLPSYSGSPFDRLDSSSGNLSLSSGGNRQLQTKAERRAEHNAIERARRESLNAKFQQLAFTLPNLQNDTRPSKSTIIDRTLDFVKMAIAKEERYQGRIRELEKFNSYLLSEADKHRQSSSFKKLRKDKLSNSNIQQHAGKLMKSIDKLDQFLKEEEESVDMDQTHEDYVDNEEDDNNNNNDDDEDDDEDEDMLTEHQNIFNSFVTPSPPPVSMTNKSKVIHPVPMVAVTGVHSLPVSQSSVPLIPKQSYPTMIQSNHWPVTTPTTSPFSPNQDCMVLKDEPQINFLQSSSFMVPKFQSSMMTSGGESKQEEEEKSGFNLLTSANDNHHHHHHLNFFNHYSAMFNDNNTTAFMNTNMVKQDHHYQHQLMHRR
ncbi:uncharacterized protein BX663DRAFT_518168 [Cokeromyces recurvatus]|uniref:uncharacterized protein n=1 Tax=Cokeromyces recurvatus TaxID=90255 RepID=UPI00221ECA9E|nr:uncharacterized protein BX663DRAFT_518168 [Cokeromyces recurvatus]KAI7900289.1 hypothetical protein BX663DRAFT_518168 [Cokeromyces recurvatus]